MIFKDLLHRTVQYEIDEFDKYSPGVNISKLQSIKAIAATVVFSVMLLLAIYTETEMSIKIVFALAVLVPAYLFGSNIKNRIIIGVISAILILPILFNFISENVMNTVIIIALSGAAFVKFVWNNKRTDCIAALAKITPDVDIKDIVVRDTIENRWASRNPVTVICICILAASVLLPTVRLFLAKSGFEMELNENGDGYTVMRYNENIIFEKNMTVEIPATYNDLPVTAIDGGAFSKRRTVATVVIPDSVTYIGGEAFLECKNLVSIEIPDAVEHIKGDTFRGCENLTYIKLPESLVEIHAYAFFECRSLGNVLFPEGLERIGAHAFHDCDSLTRVDFPESLKDIGSSAFRNCDELFTAFLPEKTKYNKRAFKESPTEVYGGNEYDPDSYSSGSIVTVPDIDYILPEIEMPEIPDFDVSDLPEIPDFDISDMPDIDTTPSVGFGTSESYRTGGDKE